MWCVETTPLARELELVPTAELVRLIYPRAAYVPSGVGVRSVLEHVLAGWGYRALRTPWCVLVCTHV